jgi:hypothetical protein
MVMSEMDEGRKFAERSAKVARETLERGKEAAEEATRNAEKGYAATVANIRDWNVKLIDMAQANAGAVFDLARQMASVQAPSDMAGVWSEHARKQFEMLSAQTNELAVIGQKIAASSTEPFARNFGQVFVRGT